MDQSKKPSENLESSQFDIVIVGGGPIGASTAYFLSQKSDKKVLLITQDPVPDNHEATYLFAGGCVCAYKPDDSKKADVIKPTVDFLNQRLEEGLDLAAIRTHYFYIDKGLMIPSLNIAGAKLINYLLEEASKNGVKIQKETKLESLEKKDGGYELTTSKGKFSAQKVLLAIGPSVHKFLPNAPVKFEKRQIFVLDKVVDDTNKDLPHTIVMLKKGGVYIFIKKVGDELKMMLSQERMFDYNDEWEAEDRYDEILDMGLAEAMPFLKDVKVEKILWGFDAENKIPEYYTEDDKLFAVNCGSAVRSCVYIGQNTADKLLS